MHIKREIWILIGILAVGALLRGLYLSELVHYPDFSAPGVDAGYHDYWARALLTGKWTPPVQYADPLIRTKPYFRPPGYPYFLAFVYLITGGSYLGARILQMALGLLGALPAFLFGRRWFGSRMGLIFAGLMSVYWGFIYFEGELVEPGLVALLALILIWDLSRWTEKVTLARSMLTGLILGVSALVRPNILLFGPVILVWAWWVLKDRRRFVTASVGLIVAAGLTISPVTIRNYIVAHDFVPISSNSGIALLMGNNEYAGGGISTQIPGIGDFNTCFDYPSLVAAVGKKVGRPVKDSEASVYFSQMAKEWVKAHPADALRLTWKKALMFWCPPEVGNNKEDQVERDHSRVLTRIPGNFALAAALFAVGALFSLPYRGNKKTSRQYQVLVLVMAFIAVYFVSYLLYFAAGRFRMPMVPFLLFFGAVGLDWVIARHDLKTVGIWAAAMVAAYGLASANFTHYQPDVAKWHLDRAIVYGNTGHTDGAIREYRESLRTKPDNPFALYNLGMQLTSRERYDEAVDCYEKALEINAEDFRAHYGLGVVYSFRNQTDDAITEFREAARLNPDFYLAHQELGLALLARKHTDEALSELLEAVRLNPDADAAHASIAVILDNQGRLDEAEKHYRKALETERSEALFIHYADLLARLRRFDEAAQAYRNAISLNPRDPFARFNLAVALQTLNKQDEAAEQYSEAIRLRPGYMKAHKNLAVLLYFKGDYAGAWREVELTRKYGGIPHPDFVKALEGKMAEP